DFHVTGVQTCALPIWRLLSALDDPDILGDLEREARALLTDAKNTPHAAAAQALFAELARMSSPTSASAATIRGLLRRARIRIEKIARASRRERVQIQM